jgi:glycine cleavage system aminomethyltransferase T
VNRHLVQLAGTAVAGLKLAAGEKEVGAVTSAVLSNRLGKGIALGYVRREFATPGMVLRAGEQSVEVIKLCGS